MKKKNLISVIYNILIATFILTIDWNDWGGVVGLPILIVLVLIVNPILTLILYRKDKNKAIIVLISFFITLIISIVLFLLKFDF